MPALARERPAEVTQRDVLTEFFACLVEVLRGPARGSSCIIQAPLVLKGEPEEVEDDTCEFGLAQRLSRCDRVPQEDRPLGETRRSRR